MRREERVYIGNMSKFVGVLKYNIIGRDVGVYTDNIMISEVGV